LDTSLNEIFRYIEIELKSRNLQKIPKETYRNIANYIKETRNLADEKELNIITHLVRCERTLLVNMGKRLLQIRLDKISESIDKEVNGMNLTAEEKYLIEPSSLSEKRFEKLSSALINGQTAVLSNVSDFISSKYIMVRFTDSLSSMIGVDFAKYGPFKKEDVAVIPLDNAKPLIKQGIVQELNLEF
jgi:DNA replication factor GINS